jgi:hypothetical protein
MSTELYRIDQVADVFVDACVRNANGIMMFLSAFGRDTAIKELLARMEIGSKGSDGLTAITLVQGAQTADSIGRIEVVLGDTKRFEKTTGRLPKCLFGNLTHLWIYDPVVQRPDKGAQQAWLLDQSIQIAGNGNGNSILSPAMAARLWSTVKTLSIVPLLDHWMLAVLTYLLRDGHILQMGVGMGAFISRPVGQVGAYQVRLPDDFAEHICSMVRSGTLNPTAPLSLTA